MNKTVVILLSVCLVHYGQTQDFHLSQYESSAQYLNPALTGAFEGNYRISAHQRSQWASIATKPFLTSALSFDMPVQKVNNLKAGAFILNNRAGAGNYNVVNFVLSAAYEFKIKNPHHRIIPALQIGFIHKSLD